MPTDDRVTKYLARVRAELRVSGGTYMDECCLLGAVEALQRLADGWESNAPEVPLLSREAAATAVRGAILAAFQDGGVINA